MKAFMMSAGTALVVLCSLVCFCRARSGLVDSLLGKNVRKQIRFPTNTDSNDYFLYRDNILRNETLWLTPLHSGGDSNCYRYEVENEHHKIIKSKEFCYPSVIVAGNHKCGTSALYQYLRMSSNTIGTNLKENCVFTAGGNLQLTQYLDRVQKKETTQYESASPVTHGAQSGREAGRDKRIAVGGCIDHRSNLYMAELLQPQTTYLYLMRDFADWLWSAYNFWCSPTYDRECGRGNWVNSSVHKRTPEVFHELMVGGKFYEEKKEYLQNQTGPSPMFVLNQPACVTAEHFYQNQYEEYLSSLVKASHHSKVMLISSEFFNGNTHKFSVKLELETGIKIHPHKLREFSSQQYNTQGSADSKGASAHVNASSYTPGLYEVSGFRPMLPETVEFLHKCWKPDCEWVSAMTKHNYSCGM